MIGRLRHMLIKEFIQVFRDKRARFFLFGPPIIQMLIFGYAATLEIKHVPTAIVDYDNSQVSRDLISRFTASRYFDVRHRLADSRQIAAVIERGDAVLAIQINAGFARRVRKGQVAHVQVIVDSSNSNTALVGLGYVNEVTGAFAGDYQLETLQRTSPLAIARMPKIVLDRRPWYNTDMSSQWFFVPGVIGNLLLVIVMTLTAFAVVREREIGTLEQIMVTPIRRAEFILGKTIPFFLIGLFDALLISSVGTLWFKVPLRGSLAVLTLGTVLFLFCVLGIGLFISTVSLTQQQAMVTGFFFIMPSIIFSGFGSPISSMPTFLQYLTYINPMRYYQTVLRGIYLKGVGLEALWPHLAAMALIGGVMLTISILRFHKSLE
ncbi:MAG: ABC transporter permease [Desulfuromonadaceae bacterium]|nr:ABC transporter permease [Desulfuromonadaceae bacterium]MDD2848006.1 ABC transporter permease [Desulfuromonadaceae bacterium]MDD4131252.1 ABC transporter permease [Desulfuromonadaceae bacterium]